MRTNAVHYFPHKLDCNFIDLVEAKFGIIGYAIINKLYERIYFEEGYYMNFNDDIGTILACKLGVKKGLVSDLVRLALARNFFDKSLYEKYQILTSEDIQLTYLEIVKKRKVLILDERYLLASSLQIYEKRSKSGEKVEEKVVNSEQRKQNETKENSSLLYIDNKETFIEGNASENTDISQNVDNDVDNFKVPETDETLIDLSQIKYANKKVINLDDFDKWTKEEFSKKIIDTFYDVSGMKEKYKSDLQIICDSFYIGLTLKKTIKLSNNRFVNKELIKFKIEHLSSEAFCKILNIEKFSMQNVKNKNIYILGMLNNIVNVNDPICSICGAITGDVKEYYSLSRKENINICNYCYESKEYMRYM